MPQIDNPRSRYQRKRSENPGILLNLCKSGPKKRDTENIPFTYSGSTAGAAGKTEVIQQYFEEEVKPHVPDAWIDWAKTKTGYEIPFTRHFYKYVPPRPLAEIDADLEKQVAKILDLLREVES